MALKKTDPLSISDRRAFDGAVGWAMLGDSREALRELEDLSVAGRLCPEVLELRWQLHAELKDWVNALAAAETLVVLAPGRPFGWIHRAYALRRAPGGGLERAEAALLPAAEKFPAEHLIPYNLACYAACLGRPDDAWRWLQRAAAVAKDARAIAAMAQVDEDLISLRDRLPELGA